MKDHGPEGSEDTDESRTAFILKRMSIKGKSHIEQCAYREIYFGELLQGSAFVARFVTHFTAPDEIWLVFLDEGMSLQQVSYRCHR